MNILALDLSLTATGVCHSDGSTETLQTKVRGCDRLRWLRDEILRRALAVDVVVIEGYSYASKGAAVVSIGELGGVVRLALHERDLPYVEIPPACRAKYMTGRGNASKDDVLQQAVFRSGRVFDDTHQADAWVLWQMALAHYRPESTLLVRVPAGNRGVLARVVWAEPSKEAA